MPSYSSTIQYCVHTEQPEFASVLAFIADKGLDYEVHLARTRFWIPRASATHTEFMLRFYHCTSEVKDND
jgi:hypothetical protein